jgi:rod shape-determining protein MreC
VDITRHDRRRRLTLVLLVITSLALVSLDERGSGIIDSARSAARDVVSPLQDVADDVINPVAEWFDGLGRADELQDQNEQLRRQLDAARAQIAAGRANQVELGNLKDVLDLPDVEDGTAVTAEVVGQGAGNFSRTLRISKGSSSGIAVGQPVVISTRDRNATALVGKISRVSANSAIVERIDDANFGVGAQIMLADQAGPPGTAEGQRDSSLLRFSVIDDSPASVELKKGDVAITIGGDVDKNYPRGLVIGTIVRTVGAGGAVRRDAALRPVVDLDALTFVKVLDYPVRTP